MTERELDIARNFGASTFLVFQVIKHKAGLDALGIEIETGLSTYTVWKCLAVLRDLKVVTYKSRAGTRGYVDYRQNVEQMLH